MACTTIILSVALTGCNKQDIPDDLDMEMVYQAILDAQVQAAGKYVCMIVLPDEYTIPEDVFSLTTE